jgi:hypothetical protein
MPVAPSKHTRNSLRGFAGIKFLPPALQVGLKEDTQVLRRLINISRHIIALDMSGTLDDDHFCLII